MRKIVVASHSLLAQGFKDTLEFLTGKSDAVNAVSPTYANELKMPFFAHRLDGIMRQCSYKLSGVLNGSGFGVAVDTPKDKPIVGSSFLAIKTEAFCEQGEFRRNVDALIDEIKNVKLEAGTDEVLMPGEIEFRAEIANREKGGVPIQPFQINELNEQAAPFGFTFEEYL